VDTVLNIGQRTVTVDSSGKTQEELQKNPGKSGKLRKTQEKPKREHKLTQ